MDRRRALAVAAGALAAGCGYALQGHAVMKDPTIKRVGVPLFKDKTGKLGLDARVTGAVITELLKRGLFNVVKEPVDVDAVVEGEIMALNVQPVGFSGSGTGDDVQQASRYAVTLVASVTYRRVGLSEPIWSNEAFSYRDEYDVGDVGASYFDREEQSLDRLADQFARSLVATMLEAF